MDCPTTAYRNADRCHYLICGYAVVPGEKDGFPSCLRRIGTRKHAAAQIIHKNKLMLVVSPAQDHEAPL